MEYQSNLSTMLTKVKYGIIAIFLSLSSNAQKKWTLEECVSYAIENNISIKQSQLDLEQTNIAKRDALGQFIPTVGAQAGHNWNFGLSNDPLTGVKQNQTTESTNFGGNVQLSLYKGLQNHHQLAKARLSKIAADYQLTKIKEDVALNVVNAYLQILFNKENEKVLKDQLTLDTKQMERSTELVEAGVIPRGDLLDAKATLASTEQRFVAAQNTLFISKIQLAQLLQLKEYETFDIGDNSSIIPQAEILNQDAKTIIDKAKETRTEIKLAQANLDVSQKDIKIAKSNFQPSLSAFYNLNTSILHRNTLVPKELIPTFSKQFSDNLGQSLGFTLNVPILNGFSVQNNVRRSKIAFEKSKLALETQQTELERTVYTAYVDTKNAQKSYEAAQQTLEARKKAANYAKERYEVGLMNVFDYNQAQNLYVSSQSEVLRAKYDFLFRTKILEFYFGIPLLKK